MSPLRVTLDARLAFHSGIGRYVRSLATELARRPAEVELALLVDPAWPAAKAAAFRGRVCLPDPAPPFSWRETLRTIPVAPGSLLHVPHLNAPWRLPRRSVLTLHDLTPFDLPHLFPLRRRLPGFLLLRRVVRRAGRIVVPSEHTRAALLRRFPAAERKTTVIPLGVDAAFAPPAPGAAAAFRARHGLDRYLLYVGTAKPHKNLDRLAAAFHRVRAAHPRLELVLVGPGTDRLAAQDGLRCLGERPDDELPAWYGAAAALVHPSLAEGFGLPALEAAACGTVVVASRRGAVEETLAGAMVGVDPEDPDDLARGITAGLADDGRRTRLRALGLERAAGLRWERTAARTIEVYGMVTPLDAPRPRSL